MNKRELIEHINNTLFDNLKDTFFTEPTFSITESAKDNKVAITFETEQVGVLVGGMLKKFEKVTIPQFVADYIRYAIENDWDFQDLFKCIEDEEDEELLRWVYHERNQETLAAAWINGYTVEKEKRYLVKMKGNVSENILVFGLVTQVYFFSKDNHNNKYRQTTHTRKELERSGFGWVFNCPGVEVKEMKE